MKKSNNIKLLLTYEDALEYAYNFWIFSTKKTNYKKYFDIIEIVPYQFLILIVSSSPKNRKLGYIVVINDKVSKPSIEFKSVIFNNTQNFLLSVIKKDNLIKTN